LFVAFLGVVAGNGIAHSRQDDEEGRKLLQISPHSLDFTAAREPTHHQSRPRVEKTRRHCPCSSRRPPRQFLDF